MLLSISGHLWARLTPILMNGHGASGYTIDIRFLHILELLLTLQLSVLLSEYHVRVDRKNITDNINPVDITMDRTFTECVCSIDSPVSQPDINDADLSELSDVLCQNLRMSQTMALF